MVDLVNNDNNGNEENSATGRVLVEYVSASYLPIFRDNGESSNSKLRSEWVHNKLLIN